MYFYVRLHFIEMSSEHSNFVLLLVPFFINGNSMLFAGIMHLICTLLLINYAAMWSLTHITV